MIYSQEGKHTAAAEHFKTVLRLKPTTAPLAIDSEPSIFGNRNTRKQ